MADSSFKQVSCDLMPICSLDDSKSPCLLACGEVLFSCSNGVFKLKIERMLKDDYQCHGLRL